MSATSGQATSALAERATARSSVEAAVAEVSRLRSRVRRFGGSGCGTNEDVAEVVADADGADGEMDEASLAVKNISEKELTEIRKLTRPPNVLRQALELVQVLLRVAEGADAKVPAKGEEVRARRRAGSAARLM